MFDDDRDRVRERIHTYRGKLIADRLGNQPPLDSEAAAKQAFLVGKIAGAQRALEAFDGDLDALADVPDPVAAEFRSLSKATADVSDAIETHVDTEDEREGFR